MKGEKPEKYVRGKWAYHMAGVAWEKSVYPTQVDNIEPSSAACINLLLASLLSLEPSRLLAKHQQEDSMQGVRLCYSAVLSLDSQCQDNNLPCLLVSDASFLKKWKEEKAGDKRRECGGNTCSVSEAICSLLL